LILSVLNRTAAEIAAAALVEMFPDIELRGGGATSLGFFYDFYFPHPISPQVEVLVEEQMRRIARERRPIRTLEMIPKSARPFLLKEGRSFRVKEIDEEESLVEIIQIGSFFDLSRGPHLKNSHEISSFKLWPVEMLAHQCYRLTGCAFPTKGELKSFLKKWRDYPARGHIFLGEKKLLWRFCEGNFLWLARGIKERSDLIQHLRSHLFKDFFEVSFPREGDRTLLHAHLKVKQCAEIYEAPCPPWDPGAGLFSFGTGLIQMSFYPSAAEFEETLISSLQLVEKTLNILSFKYRLRLTLPSRPERDFQRVVKALECLGGEIEKVEQERGSVQIDFLAEDGLGRSWSLFSWRWAGKGFYVTGSIERLYAFLLEMSV
jgi:hypothetical protein